MKRSRPPDVKQHSKAYRTAPKVKHRKAIWLNVLPEDRWFKVKRDITLLDALQENELQIDGECGGLGTCGKCKVRVVTAVGQPDEQEKAVLTEEELRLGDRLACRIRIEKDLVVHTAASPSAMDLFQILKYGQTPPLKLDPLINAHQIKVTPPSLQNPASDFYRLRSALGPGYENLTITSRCLGSLFRDLRRTNFSGRALIHQKCLLAWQARHSVKGRYGIVFDIGTTTLVGKLIDLTNGREISVISRLNSQVRFGSDVINRIAYVRQKKQGLKRMRELLLRDINLITRRLLETRRLIPADILVAVAAGNTTMQHFLMGLDPSGIAEAPFTPVITEGVTFRTAELGLELHPDAMLYVMPSRSGYIGGDLISFILTADAMEETQQIVLGLDFGTNGEIFLGNGGRMLTCSAAAGPALEGARISHGMMAREGAIEAVRVNGSQLQYQVISNTPARGLCGSGLVDLTAVLLHYGVIDREGLLSPHRIQEAGDLFRSRMIRRRRQPVWDFVVDPGDRSQNRKRILLTQKDIRELQLAKAAIAAGVAVLMRRFGITVGDLNRIYLAGALGNYVNPYSAMRIGLIPQVPVEKIVSMGNAASTGAKMALLSKSHWQKARQIAERIEHVELSVQPDFYDCFVKAMDFPDRNLW
jgi:uncharacterized 2Fe-2S/4Fe-4S cluster protein (DUF4445 family)